MAEGPAEKKDGFERWVASLKLEARTLNVPGARVETAHDSSEPPPSGPLSFDEQVTLVQRLPKDIVKALRERESSRAARGDSNRPLGKVDEESTAVFVPPPELLARAKRFQPPPKPGRPSQEPPPENLAPLSDVPGADIKNDSELPTMPPPPMPFDELPAPRSAPRHEVPERESYPGRNTGVRTSAIPERRNPSVPVPDRRSAPAPNNIRTPTFAFEAARLTPSEAFPPTAKATPAGAFRAPTPAGAFRAPTPAGAIPAAAAPRAAAARSNVTRPTAPGVPSSVPRGFSAALFPSRAEPPAPVVPPQLDAVESEEPTSRARFSPPDVMAAGILPSAIVNIDVDSERPPGPPPLIESVAPPTAEVDSAWDEDEAETRAAPSSSRASAAPESTAPERAAQSSAPPAGEAQAAASGSGYLLFLGWTAAALIVAGAVWLTFFK
jgi:hypothetical protein